MLINVTVLLLVAISAYTIGVMRGITVERRLRVDQDSPNLVKPTPDVLRAMADWFEDPDRNQGQLAMVSGTPPSGLLRQLARELETLQ